MVDLVHDVSQECSGEPMVSVSTLPSRDSEFTKKWVDLFLLIACIAIGVMLCISIVEILGNKLGHPLLGAVDMIGFIGIVLSSFAFTSAYVGNRHIRVDILVTRVPKKLQIILNVVSSFFTLMAAMVLIMASIIYALDMQINSTKSMTLETPLSPFAFVLAFALIPFLWVVLKELINIFRRGQNK